jgi:hypothetical protein
MIPRCEQRFGTPQGDQFTGDVKKFDLACGAILASFNTNNNTRGFDLADGIAIAP